MATRVDDVQEPKHEVFLCHSGAQKNFVEQLCVDLERVSYVPFFDRRHESLEKAATFPDRIFNAIRHCSVFVLVLSEDFFTQTKWPMVELTEAVKALSENPKLKLLPLFFQISPSDLKEQINLDRWSACWKKWELEDPRINVRKWEKALMEVRKWNGEVLTKSLKNSEEVSYRKRIVESICRICPINGFDVPLVVGRERLCEIVARQFEELKRESQCQVKVPQLGVYGMGGLGKTTLCKVMCNHYFSDFGGKVIHIELKLNAIVEQQENVIRNLTGAARAIDDPEKGHRYLIPILSTHKVFLALDNVIDDPENLKEVGWYLSAVYGVGSMILVTSRSREVLVSKLGIAENHCMEVPDLNEAEAISLFLQAGPPKKHKDFSSYSDAEKNRIEEGVRLAFFARTLRQSEQFHPLALKVVASRLIQLIHEPRKWRETLQQFDLKFTQYKAHDVFSILGSSYEMLSDKEKLMFMDIALFKPSCVTFTEDVCKWLRIVHKVQYGVIKEHLSSLIMKSLLEEGLGEEDIGPTNFDRIGGCQVVDMCSGPQVVVHDLYVEFAKLESSSDSLGNIQCFSHDDFDDLPLPMQESPSGGPCWPLKRIALTRGSLRSSSACRFGKYYKNVKVLKLEYLTSLTDLNIEGMSCLASVDILCCYKLCNIHGLQTLTRLAWLRVARCEELEVLPNLQDFSSLEYVEVRNTSKEICPIISSCKQLSELRLSSHYAITDLSNIQVLDGLRKVTIEWCPKLCTLPKLQDFKLLRELHVLDCPELRGVMEIGSLVYLHKLHLRCIKISELGGVGSMQDLCQLVCEQCPDLQRICGLTKLTDEICGLTKLTLLRLSHCPKLDGVLAVGSLPALEKLHVTDIAVKELNGIGKLRCLCEFVWKLSPKFTNIQVHSKSFTLEDIQPLRCFRKILQGTVNCHIGNVNHGMDIMMEHAVIVVERGSWCFMMVRSAFDVNLEESELENDDFCISNVIPDMTATDLEFQTTLQFFYGHSLGHVNDGGGRIEDPRRTVSFVENMLQGLKGPAMRTLGVGNICALYLEDLQIGHLHLIGMKCLSKLYICRCRRLSRPVILEALLELEYVKMEDCEYLDDVCTAMRIRKCRRLQGVKIIEHKKLRPIFVFDMGTRENFKNLPIEDIEHVQVYLHATWKDIEWYHNMYVKVNIECYNNILNDDPYGFKSSLLFFKMYIAGVVPELPMGAMNMMIKYVNCCSMTNDTRQSCCWTLLVLKSTSVGPGENLMDNFQASLGRSSIPNIALEFAMQDLHTRLCFFDGVGCQQVLQCLPNNWRPITIVSFTGDKFHILNEEHMSKRLGNITTLHLKDIEFENLDLQGLECVIRLELRNVRNLTSGPIRLHLMPTLEYIRLVDLKYGKSYCPALSLDGCPRLQKLKLYNCLNVHFVLEDISGDIRLKKLVIKDCPDLLNIHFLVPETHLSDGYVGAQVKCKNCPKWGVKYELDMEEVQVAKEARSSRFSEAQLTRAKKAQLTRVRNVMSTGIVPFNESFILRGIEEMAYHFCTVECRVEGEIIFRMVHGMIPHLIKRAVVVAKEAFKRVLLGTEWEHLREMVSSPLRIRPIRGLSTKELLEAALLLATAKSMAMTPVERMEEAKAMFAEVEAMFAEAEAMFAEAEAMIAEAEAMIAEAILPVVEEEMFAGPDSLAVAEAMYAAVSEEEALAVLAEVAERAVPEATEMVNMLEGVIESAILNAMIIVAYDGVQFMVGR